MSKTDKPSKADIPPSAAATNIPEFIGDLEAGLVENQLSMAVSETAAAVVDHEKKKKGGKVVLTLEFEHIEGTQQCRIAHQIKYERPTRFGKKGEICSGASVMHVGKRGKLTVTQPEFEEVPPRQAQLDA